MIGIELNTPFVYGFPCKNSNDLQCRIESMEKEEHAEKIQQEDCLKQVEKVFDDYPLVFKEQDPSSTTMYQVIYSSESYFCELALIFGRCLETLIAEMKFIAAGRIYKNIIVFQSNRQNEKLALTYNVFANRIAQQLLKMGEQVAILYGPTIGHNVAVNIALDLAKKNKLDKALFLLQQLKEKDCLNPPPFQNYLDGALEIFNNLVKQNRFVEAIPFAVLGYADIDWGGNTIWNKIRRKFTTNNLGDDKIRASLKTAQLFLDNGYPKNFEKIIHINIENLSSSLDDIPYIPQLIRLFIYNKIKIQDQDENQHPFLVFEVEEQSKIAFENTAKAITLKEEEQPGYITKLRSDINKNIADAMNSGVRNLLSTPPEVAGIIADYVGDEQLLFSRDILRKCLLIDPDFNFDPDTLLESLRN